MRLRVLSDLYLEQKEKKDTHKNLQLGLTALQRVPVAMEWLHY